MAEGFLRLTRKWPEGAAVAALRDIDAASHKKHRSACRRINQCFLKLVLFFSIVKKPWMLKFHGCCKVSLTVFDLAICHCQFTLFYSL